MYSLRRSIRWVRNHLADSTATRRPAETFVLAVFMIEKLLRRTLMQMMVSACFTTEEALELLQNVRGIQAIRNAWRFYDPQGRTLPQILGDQLWQAINDASVERNRLVHGIGHRQERQYQRWLPDLLDAIGQIHNTLSTTYGYGGWRGFEGREQTLLHTDPKITT